MLRRKPSAPGATAEPVTISTSCATNIQKEAENTKTEQHIDTKHRCHQVLPGLVRDSNIGFKGIVILVTGAFLDQEYDSGIKEAPLPKWSFHLYWVLKNVTKCDQNW